MPGNTKKYSSNKPYLFQAILQWLIDNQATPYVQVDASRQGVLVPQEHVKDWQITLNISPSAVKDWYMDKQAISFKSRFSGVSHDIYLPMDAVMAIFSKENGLGMAFAHEESDDREYDDRESNHQKNKNSAKNQQNSDEFSQSDKQSTPIKPSTPQKKPSGKKSSHLKLIK